MLLSSQSIIGYGQETSWANVAAPTDFFPVNPLTAGNFVKYRKINSKPRLYGTILNIPTFSGGKVDCTHFATQASVMDELRGMFGQESINGNTHTFSLVEIPPSFTITEYDGEYCRAYAGARMEQWVVAFDVEQGLTCQATWWSKMAQSSTWNSATVPMEIPPTVHQGSVSIAGTPIASVESGQWTFTRALQLIHNDNQQDVSSIYPGPFVAECDLTLVVEDDGLWNDMVNGTQDSVSMTFDWLTIYGYLASFEEVSMDRGSELLKQQVKLRSVYSNAADGMVYATVTT